MTIRARQVARVACGPCTEPHGRPRFVGVVMVAGQQVEVCGVTPENIRKLDAGYDRGVRGSAGGPESGYSLAWSPRTTTDADALTDEQLAASTPKIDQQVDGFINWFKLTDDHAGKTHPVRCPRHGVLAVEEATLADAARGHRSGRPRVVLARRPNPAV